MMCLSQLPLVLPLKTGTSRDWKVGDEVLGLAGGVSYILT